MPVENIDLVQAWCCKFSKQLCQWKGYASFWQFLPKRCIYIISQACVFRRSWSNALMLTTNAAFGPISAPTVITRENVGKMIEYLPWQDDSKGFTLLIQHNIISWTPKIRRIQHHSLPHTLSQLALRQGRSQDITRKHSWMSWSRSFSGQGMRN